MFAVPVTRETRPIGVLLGGSGRARMLTAHKPPLAALLRPCQRAAGGLNPVLETRAVPG